jgi:hypothetical protein
MVINAVRILAAARIREQLDGPVMLQGHAGVFQHLKGRVMDFLLVGFGKRSAWVRSHRFRIHGRIDPLLS